MDFFNIFEKKKYSFKEYFYNYMNKLYVNKDCYGFKNKIYCIETEYSKYSKESFFQYILVYSRHGLCFENEFNTYFEYLIFLEKNNQKLYKKHSDEIIINFYRISHIIKNYKKFRIYNNDCILEYKDNRNINHLYVINV